MKVVTTNRLNRFWKNGVKPIKDALAGKLDSSKIANNLTTTASGYALDARQGRALKNNRLTTMSEIELATESGTFVDALAVKELINKLAVKEYTQSTFSFQSFYNVADFKCYRVGKTVHFTFGVSVKAGTTLNPDYLYTLNSAALPAELRPTALTNIICIGCNSSWGGARAGVAYVGTDGFIKYATPIKQDWYKFHGSWRVA